MSEKTVRTLTTGSNRARQREGEDRKVVYRSVLDNPFRVQWPVVPVNVQNAVLARALEMLEGVSDYFLHRKEQSRKRKREKQDQPRTSEKKRKTISGVQEPSTEQAHSSSAAPSSAQHDIHVEVQAMAVETMEEANSWPTEPPDVLKHLTIGINDVTRLLEKFTASDHPDATETTTVAPGPSPSPIAKVILVCRADVDPPILISHLPHLVAACNSRSHAKASGDVVLIPLPKGAEFSLASTIGVRRASVLAIDASAPNFSSLLLLLDNIPRLRASWLLPQVEASPPALIPTHIKQLKTSAPKDMKAAKEQRSHKKAEAKERRRARKATESKQIQKTFIVTTVTAQIAGSSNIAVEHFT